MKTYSIPFLIYTAHKSFNTHHNSSTAQLFHRGENTRKADAQTTHTQMQNKYTPVTQSILCLIFPVYIRIIQRLNYGGQESKKLFAVYNSDIPMA